MAFGTSVLFEVSLLEGFLHGNDRFVETESLVP